MEDLIGVTSYYVSGATNRSNPRGLPEQDLLMSTMDYFRMIRRGGGFPVSIPVLEDGDYIEELVKRCSGLVFTGGADIYPFHYNQPVNRGLGLYVPERDAFELKLLEKILPLGKPILGICRGLHLINTYFGGTLHQDIGRSGLTEIEHVGSMGPKYGLIHRIRIAPGSRISSIFKEEEIWVNSLHHQAIDRLGQGLLETAWGEDGIIEAIEHKDHPYLLAVQWHPEMMGEVHREQEALFKDFLDYSLQGEGLWISHSSYRGFK